MLDPHSGDLISSLEEPDGAISIWQSAPDGRIVVALSPDGTRFVTTGTSTDGLETVRVWDTSNGDLVQTLGLPAAVLADTLPLGLSFADVYGRFSPDGRLLELDFGNGHGPLGVVWNLATSELVFYSSGIEQLRLSPDATMVVGTRYVGADTPSAGRVVEVYEL